MAGVLFQWFIFVLLIAYMVGLFWFAELAMDTTGQILAACWNERQSIGGFTLDLLVVGTFTALLILFWPIVTGHHLLWHRPPPPPPPRT